MEQDLNDVELPDLSGDEETLAALEAITIDIDSFLADVREAGGVSRGMVEKASHLLPTDTNYGYYSQTPTQTNLKVTLESIDLKTVLVLVAAVAAVAALAYKVFEMIKKSRQKLEFTFKVISGYVESIDRGFKVSDKIVGNMNDEAKRKVKQIESELTQLYVRQVEEFNSPVSVDALGNGKFSSALGKALPAVKDLFKRLEDSIEDLDKLTAGNIDKVDTKSLIDIHDKKVPELLSVIYKSSEDKAGPAMGEIAQDLVKAHTTKIKFVDTFEEAFSKYRKFTGSDSALYGTYAGETGKLERRLKDIEARLNKKKDVDPDMRKEVHLAMYSIRSGVQQIMAFERMVSLLATNKRHFWYCCERYASAKLKKISALALHTDDPEVKEALHEASKIKLTS